jgi:hypothetical protein
MQRVLCSAVISIMSSILLVPQVGLSADDGLCFLHTESGLIIGLDALCLRRSQKKPMWKIVKITDDLDPKYAKYVTHRSSADGTSSFTQVKHGADISFQLPSGAIVDPDGTTTEPNGTKYRGVYNGDQLIGVQYFRPDGTPAAPGEKLTLPNGETIEQMKF